MKFLFESRLSVMFICMVALFSANDALARCEGEQRETAELLTAEAVAAVDSFERLILLRRSLKECPDFITWLSLGQVELELNNFADAAYAFENARDFYRKDAQGSFTATDVERIAIANGWLAETYMHRDELALAMVAAQEARDGFSSIGRAVPERLIELQAKIDDALIDADASILTRSFETQHQRASRGIGVRPKIRDHEPSESEVESNTAIANAYDSSMNAGVVSPDVTSLPMTSSRIADSVDTQTESRLNIPVLFGFDSAKLTSRSLNTIAQLSVAIQRLNLAKSDKVLVIGHTDARGSADYNLHLSRRRARAVLDEIRQISGTIGNLVSSGRGETRLRYTGDSDDDDRRNRRVEVVILR